MDIYRAIGDYIEQNSKWPAIAIKDWVIILRGVNFPPEAMAALRAEWADNLTPRHNDVPILDSKLLAKDLALIFKIGTEWPLCKIDDLMVHMTWVENFRYKKEGKYVGDRAMNIDVANPDLFKHIDQFLIDISSPISLPLSDAPQTDQN